MNAVVGTYRDEMEMDGGYTIDYRRERGAMPHRSRRPEHRRSSAAPACVNGIHRRRQKRWTWGTGRGARMSSLRAIASVLALAVAGLMGAASAAPLVTIDYATVGNPGNVATSGTAGPSRGSVSRVFEIAKYETSNSDYVKFLNTTDASGSNQYLTYSGSMTTDTANGGILFSSGSAAGQKYSVRSGFELKPVTYVSWFSAARFANWLNNGGSGTSSTETGAYTLSGTLSGAPIARNAGALVFLPSLDEFTKAAYYDPTLNSGTGGYYNYASMSNTAPTAAASGTGTNLANYGSLPTGLVNGNALPNADSYYGLFNAFGNVGEYTDTSSPDYSTGYRVAAGGINWRIKTADAATWGSQNVKYAGLAGETDRYGFRVAAVPEPGAMVLAALGLGGAFGGEYLRRRRRRREPAC